MKSSKKKIWSFALAILLVLSALLGMVACNDTPDNPDDPDNNPGTDDGNTNEQERIPLDYLPQDTFGKEGAPATFNIIQYAYDGRTGPDSSGVIPWEEGDMDAPDGSMVSEAVFARNAAVEERYNVEITAEYGSVNMDPSLQTLITSNHESGDDRYQLMTTRSLDLRPYIVNGMLLDMNDYSQYLHTDMPWWVSDAVTSFTLGEHLYATSTEMLLRDKGATAAVFFNQTLAKDYEDLSDFFALVRNGAWTVYEMSVAAEMVAHDADGSDLLDSQQDVWGMVADDSTSIYLYNGYGLKFARVNEDGYLEAEFSTGDTISITQDIFTDVMFADWYANYGYVDQTKFNLENGGRAIFAGGSALFTTDCLKYATTAYSNMTDIYGILPIPMYDTNQDDYYSLVYAHHDCVLGILSSVGDPEMCAVILETLSWESYYTVSPTFYEAILLDRSAKDADSKDMIELILDTRVYDPGQIWSTSLAEHVLRDSTKAGSADIASLWASNGTLFEMELEDFNNIIADIN